MASKQNIYDLLNILFISGESVDSQQIFKVNYVVGEPTPGYLNKGVSGEVRSKEGNLEKECTNFSATLTQPPGEIIWLRTGQVNNKHHGHSMNADKLNLTSTHSTQYRNWTPSFKSSLHSKNSVFTSPQSFRSIAFLCKKRILGGNEIVK